MRSMSLLDSLLDQNELHLTFKKSWLLLYCSVVGLMYMISEMCIDDCRVFCDRNIKFVSRLSLFERFREHKRYSKANKCFFGFTELEFVGKVLSEEELKISHTKI